MHDQYWHGWGGLMMWIYWVPLILIGVWLVIKITNQMKSAQATGETPLEILKRRYANGEITTEEYEERRKVLESH